ncbi:hypothetical protein EMIHUDRAFT_100046 [Emiliania huxleyi CCMP1516]|uniref:Tubulin-specific chaperone A n=3 Tax=Emiliania huxleyi TaxID=2903 RepID=A0A0D3J309_EMIH1|nr:hypothetical protein EMIHUDRAFT_209928 [Emiliania huxleyi CCMP1516]XP_005781020.1 hypothetical protein EMIHUDRAFT_100046 [Emiliania huxleyi CCMP1516]EOD17894.1 hypothetical protein EMIHUDRAFT_209928 [Emiliania huxleyi CCMP1516]EOD28591.1 hypothetical protein EMIHUDRAFT_100046 [Emiliania huxleyi CCMP1516]|eukprot:XP_005770323.1 hypothetical protein EMIHUDRAFT_209928 [Emiliania huxleyi CCMP1516]
MPAAKKPTATKKPAASKASDQLALLAKDVSQWIHKESADISALYKKIPKPASGNKEEKLKAATDPQLKKMRSTLRECHRATTDIKDTHDAALADVQKTTEDGLRQLRGAAAASAAVMSDASESDGDF